MRFPRLKNAYDPETGLRVAAIRAAIGLTQTALAEAIGMQQSELARAESGKAMLAIQYGLELSRVSGAPLDYIYRGELSALPVQMTGRVAREVLAERTRRFERDARRKAKSG